MSGRKANKTTKLIDIISAMSDGYIDSLTTRQLIEASMELFKLVILCSCIKSNKLTDMPSHTCHEFFNRRETVHNPECECCQTRLFLTYFSLALKRLDGQDQLPEFSQNNLTKAKVCDRTFGFTTSQSKLRFKIIRHQNAWKNLRHYRETIQQWEFDFEKLTLLRIVEVPINKEKNSLKL